MKMNTDEITRVHRERCEKENESNRVRKKNEGKRMKGKE